MIQTYGASYEQPAKTKGFFWKRDSADQGVDDIESVGVVANEFSGTLRETKHAESALHGRRCRLGERVREAKLFDFMSGFSPFLGQLDPDPRGAETRIPREI